MANSFVAQLADALKNSWPAVARRNQLPPPGDLWQVWLLLAGRGFGKTRTLRQLEEEARRRVYDLRKAHPVSGKRPRKSPLTGDQLSSPWRDRDAMSRAAKRWQLRRCI